jgi:hypothetical protein
MPQCAVAARKCLSKVIELHETTKDSSSSIAIFDQAWVSSTTFLITIWHELPPERLAEDAHLVEGTLHIFARHDPRFWWVALPLVSSLLRLIICALQLCALAPRTPHPLHADQARSAALPRRASRSRGVSDC